MANIKFDCPACEQVLEAPDEMAGEAIECPSCESEITIPHQAQPAQEDTLVLPNLPDIQIGSPAASPVDSLCPECGAALGGGAVLCVACGFHLKLGKKISTEFD